MKNVNGVLCFAPFFTNLDQGTLLPSLFFLPVTPLAYVVLVPVALGSERVCLGKKRGVKKI